jgi:hypothetical protein
MIIDALIGSPACLKHPPLCHSYVGNLSVGVESAHDVVLAASASSPVRTLALLLLLLLAPQVLHGVVLRHAGVVRVVGAGGVGLLVRVVVVAQLGGAGVVAGAGARALAAAATDARRACDHRKTVDNTR